MKNFTKQILNKTLFKPTRWLLIAFMFLLGTGGVWAQSWYTLSSDAYFYFNDNVSWTSSTQKAVLLVGRKWTYGNEDVGSNAYSMSNISNTKLHYYKVSAWGSGDNGKYTDIAILSAKSSDSWSGWEGNAASTRRTYASKYSTVRNDNVSGKTAYYVGTTGANNDPLTFNGYSGYANIPTYTATLAVQTRKGISGTYSSITSGAPATLKLQGTVLSAHGTSSRTATEASEVTWPTTKTRTAVVTGLVTVSYSSLSEGYTFDGWYEGSTQKSTATSYSYNQSANTTITAKFTAKQYTITYKDQGGANFSGTHASGYPTTHTYGTETTLKSPSKTGYNFLGWFTNSACTGNPVTTLGATAYTANITLYAQWELDCEKPAEPQLSVNKKINVCEGKDNTYGYIKIDNYDSYSNCKFYLGSENNEITNNISEGLIGVNVPSSYKVIVKNDCGSTNEAIIDFTATNILTPTGSVSISGNSPICSGKKATLTAKVTTSNTISSYTWTKNDGSAHGGTLSNNGETLTTASLTANTSYKVSVTLTNSGCPKTFDASNNPYIVTVNSAPSKPTVTLSPDDGNIISGNKATLSVSSPESDATYTLYERTRGKIEEGKTSFEITEAGTYYVKGANDCGESSASDEKIVKVCAAAPTVTIEGVTAPVATCKTLKAYFKITNIGGDACSMLEQKSGIRFYVTEEDARNDKNKKVGMLVTGIPAVNTEYNLTADYDWILPGTTYYYRAFAENCYGSVMSETIGSITTPASDLVVGTIRGTNNVCSGTSTTLTLNGMTNGTVTKWQKSTDNSSFTDIANTTTTLNTGNLSVNTYFRAVVSSSSCREKKNTASYLVSVTPLPTITANKNSCAPYDEVTLTSAAGAGTTWSTTENGILSATTGQTVTFKAPAGEYTVTASANGCEDTETITVACAEEVCNNTPVTDDSKFQIWCKSTLTGSLYLHIWYEKGNSDVNITSWPGTKVSKDGNYFKWEFSDIESGSNIGYIFHDNTDNNKTPDANKTLYKGKRYNFTYNGGKYAATVGTEETLTKPGVAITTPTVKTVSAVQKDGEPVVVIKGFLQAKGCADITKYGFEYKQEGAANFTDAQVAGSKNNCDEWELECEGLEFGETYIFRAKATNSSKEGTGNEIQVTILGQSTPVVIKAIRNDKTVNESHWADFVALYVQEDGITAAGATKVTNYTWQYSTNKENWETNFTGYVLGGASATVGVTNGSEKCNNIRPTKTGSYRVKVTYDNSTEEYSNIITITNDGFKLKYPEYGQNAGQDFAFDVANRTIPVIVVKTTEDFPGCPASGMPSQDVEGQKAKRSVDVKMFDKDGNLYYDRKARMNYRGSSSLNFRKKSYAFCTGKEKTKNNKGDVDTGKENLFGLSNGAKDKDWVLYAAMPDPSMMRNRLVFDTYAQMTGKWGVNSKFVELIIDDEYMGVYVLMDKITNNENRINITDKNGFILKFDKTDVSDRFENEESDKRNTFTTYYTGKSDIGSYGATFDQRFEIEYPEMENMTTEKWIEFVKDNVQARIKNFEDALAAGNYSEVRNIIDYTSWADWFIISEFAKNVDAYRASCLFVYNGDKIEARPLWDQELSFNNTATTVGDGKGCNNTSGLLVQNNGVYSDAFPAPFWFTGRRDNSLDTDEIKGWLLNDPCFVSVVQKRWKDHLNNALSADQLNAKIADYQEELTAKALDREIVTWRPESGEITACTDGGTGYNNIKVSTSIETMTDWLADRPEGLSAALDELKGNSIKIEITPSFVETYPWEPFTLEVNAPESYEYDMAFTKEGVDATTDMEVQKVNDTYTIRIKRPSNTLDYVFSTVPYLATAKVKVDDDGCGGMAKPEANVNIRLNDREEVCEP